MKNKCLFVVVLLFAFVLFDSSTRTSSAGYMFHLNEEEQTSDTTVLCADAVEKLQQDKIFVDTAFIKINRVGKILYKGREPVKDLYGDNVAEQFVSFKRFVELNHKGHKILQVQYNFNAFPKKVHIFYEELPKK